MRKTQISIFSFLATLLLLIHLSCLEGGVDEGANGAGTSILIRIPTLQCIESSTELELFPQEILDEIVSFELTITDGFDPIVANFGQDEPITVFVPVGNKRNFMIVGFGVDGQVLCRGAVTADV
ncbi:MAG: hypothetical protein ACRENZ_00780, partial [Thermodesulfobacteriota bacterium]